MSGFFESAKETAFILPRLDWNAKEGRLYRFEKVPGPDGNFVGERIEVDKGTRIQLDLGRLQMGWVAFTSTGPDLRMLGADAMQRAIEAGSVPGQPSPNHNRGVRFHSMIAGETVPRETTSTSKAVIAAILSLYEQCKPLGFNGMAPIVVYEGWRGEDIKFRDGSKVRLYKPALAFEKMGQRSKYFQVMEAQAPSQPDPEPVARPRPPVQDAKPRSVALPDDEIPF